MDRKTVRKHLEVGIGSPTYSPRAAQPRLIARYEDYLRARITAWPDLSGKRLLRELKERGYTGCYTRMRTACAPGVIWVLISARCRFIALMLTHGSTSAAPTPRAGQTAPNR